jgi:anti-anti-sigma regulatory factor
VTCKIHRQAIAEGLVVLRVSGRLAGKNVDMLRTLLEQENNVLTLDLKDLRLVDGDAVRLLAIHESNGVRIDNCPLYIREWIRREREAT